jgi:hypothetical protein
MSAEEGCEHKWGGFDPYCEHCGKERLSEPAIGAAERKAMEALIERERYLTSGEAEALRTGFLAALAFTRNDRDALAPGVPCACQSAEECDGRCGEPRHV